MVSTFSGPSLSTNLFSNGRSTDLTKRAIGRISSKPIGAPRRVAAPRSSSVAPDSRARSLASPAEAPTPSNPAIPVAARVGAPATPAIAAGAAIPAMEPNA